MNAGEILNSTYEIREEIGSGGGGTIYRAYHKRLQKDVVLKKIHHSTGRNEDEKEILKNIKHSYLPQVYDFLDVEDGVFTIIDYIPGQSFEKLLKEKKRFSQKKVVRYAIQLCEAVDYLHKQRPPILHGDIKPANIMLTPQDNICLIDFNISGVLDGKSMAAMGYTPGYASPEQAASFQGSGTADIPAFRSGSAVADYERTELLNADDERTELLNQDDRTELLNRDDSTELLADVSRPIPEERRQTSQTGSRRFAERYSYQVDVRSDVYSIGATLYHLLTGIRPDRDPNRIIKPSEVDPSIGESISIILMKALNPDPRQRFQSVESMLKAFRKIHKYDFRYKRLILQQELIFLTTALCIGAGILLVFFGKQQLGTEKEEAYVQAVAMLTDAVADREDEQRIEEMYGAAREIKPERLEAYFQKALYYYGEKRYETAIEYIEGAILPESAFFEQEMMADIYFILANCRFELEEYEDAVNGYQTAISRDESKPEFYRDYVIALVRIGEVERAEAALSEAEEKGISSVDLLLVNGELKKAKGDYTGAEQDLKQCISQTGDDRIRMRAYVICDMVYAERDAASGPEGGIDALLDSRDLLEEARTRVGLENQLLIYERLAQTYIDLQERTSETGYGESAVSVLRELIDRGWGTYLTYNNIAILYQKMGKPEDAREILNVMLSLDAENYNTYKRLALLEVEIQNGKENGDRNYADFVQYRERARELYESGPSAGGDAEMQLLDNLYGQLVEGGWLK